MLNPNHFRLHVVRPTLKRLAPAVPYSQAAENLLMGTWFQESHGEHLRQLPRRDGRRGPARSGFQIEPYTHRLHWKWLAKRTDIERAVLGFVPQTLYLRPNTSRAVWSGLHQWLMDCEAYACAIARIIYYAVPDPLPHKDDVPAMAEYWQTKYHRGATPASEFLKNYRVLKRREARYPT